MVNDFSARYSAWIAALNQRNHARYGFFWWALNLTNKNPIATRLCDSLARQKMPRLKPISYFLRWVFPWGLLRTLCRLAALGLYWRLLAPRIQPISPPPVLLWSLFNHQSFDDKGFRDAYFGSLPGWLKQTGQPVILTGQTMQHPFKTLYRMARQPPSYPVQPMESVLTFSDYVWIAWKTLQAHYGPPLPQEIPPWENFPVKPLLHSEIIRNVRSSRWPTDLAFYRAARRFAERTHFWRVIYPFENRSWEKMILSAVRENPDHPEAWGYQHAVLTPKHLNFILENGEGVWTPLPERILTMGEVSRQWMIQHGYEAPRLEVGAALRRPAVVKAPRRPRPKVFQKLLITLATDYQEYAGVFRLLRDVHSACPTLKLQIRPHPVFPLKGYFKRYGEERFPFTENHGPLSAALNDCDLLGYSASTLGLDALSAGLPVFNLAWGDYLATDPLMNFSTFKWRISNGQDAQKALADLTSLPQEEFARRQNEGKAYAESYALEPTPERLSRFVQRVK